MSNYTEIPKNETTKLSVCIARLNLGDFEGDKYFLALAYIKNINSYVCFVKENSIFTIDNFIVLDKNINKSRVMIEEHNKTTSKINSMLKLKTSNKKKRKTRKNKHQRL